jgi:hypothetical protein
MRRTEHVIDGGRRLIAYWFDDEPPIGSGGEVVDGILTVECTGADDADDANED